MNILIYSLHGGCFFPTHTQTQHSPWKQPQASHGGTIGVRIDDSLPVSTVSTWQEDQTRYTDERPLWWMVADMGRTK
jgi:hypothetical protein